MPDDDPGLRFEVLVEQEQVLDRTGAREAQREVLDRLLATAGDDPERRAHALVAQGRWLFFHSDYASTVPVAQEATALAVQVGRADLELQALLLTGRALAFRGDHAAAREHLGRLLVRAQEVGSLREVAETQRLLGRGGHQPARAAGGRRGAARGPPPPTARPPTWRARRWPPASWPRCTCSPGTWSRRAGPRRRRWRSS